MIWFCIFDLGCVMSQSLKYGGIHDNHFEYIQTTITSLFLRRFRIILHRNKWLAKHSTPKHTYSLYCVYLTFFLQWKSIFAMKFRSVSRRKQECCNMILFHVREISRMFCCEKRAIVHSEKKHIRHLYAFMWNSIPWTNLINLVLI